MCKTTPTELRNPISTAPTQQRPQSVVVTKPTFTCNRLPFSIISTHNRIIITWLTKLSSPVFVFSLSLSLSLLISLPRPPWHQKSTGILTHPFTCITYKLKSMSLWYTTVRSRYRLIPFPFTTSNQNKIFTSLCTHETFCDIGNLLSNLAPLWLWYGPRAVIISCLHPPVTSNLGSMMNPWFSAPSFIEENYVHFILQVSFIAVYLPLSSHILLHFFAWSIYLFSLYLSYHISDIINHMCVVAVKHSRVANQISDSLPIINNYLL